LFEVINNFRLYDRVCIVSALSWLNVDVEERKKEREEKQT
jgi:hypothetical protein